MNWWNTRFGRTVCGWLGHTWWSDEWGGATWDVCERCHTWEHHDGTTQAKVMKWQTR